jgi:hypothetical protein
VPQVQIYMGSVEILETQAPDSLDDGFIVMHTKGDPYTGPLWGSREIMIEELECILEILKS